MEINRRREEVSGNEKGVVKEPKGIKKAIGCGVGMKKNTLKVEGLTRCYSQDPALPFGPRGDAFTKKNEGYALLLRHDT